MRTRSEAGKRKERQGGSVSREEGKEGRRRNAGAERLMGYHFAFVAVGMLTVTPQRICEKKMRTRSEEREARR